MKRLILLIFITIIIILFSSSCIETTFTYRINENGRVSISQSYTAINDYAYTMIKDLKDNLVEEGYQIIKSDYKTVEGIQYSELKDSLSDDIFDMSDDSNKFDFNNIKFSSNTNIKEETDRKLFIVDYRFDKTEIDEESEYAALYISVLSSFKINFIISFPGEILETNGNILSESSVSWNYSLLELFKDGGRIYLKTYIDKNIDGDIIKSNRLKVYQITSQLDELIYKKVTLDIMNRYQIELNERINEEKKKSDRYLIEVLNILNEEYYKEYGGYPASIKELNSFAVKYGFKNIPDINSGTIIYNKEFNKYEVLE